MKFFRFLSIVLLLSLCANTLTAADIPEEDNDTVVQSTNCCSRGAWRRYATAALVGIAAITAGHMGLEVSHNDSITIPQSKITKGAFCEHPNALCLDKPVLAGDWDKKTLAFLAHDLHRAKAIENKIDKALKQYLVANPLATETELLEQLRLLENKHSNNLFISASARPQTIVITKKQIDYAIIAPVFLEKSGFLEAVEDKKLTVSQLILALQRAINNYSDYLHENELSARIFQRTWENPQFKKQFLLRLLTDHPDMQKEVNVFFEVFESDLFK